MTTTTTTTTDPVREHRNAEALAWLDLLPLVDGHRPTVDLADNRISVYLPDRVVLHLPFDADAGDDGDPYVYVDGEWQPILLGYLTDTLGLDDDDAEALDAFIDELHGQLAAVAYGGAIDAIARLGSGPEDWYVEVTGPESAEPDHVAGPLTEDVARAVVARWEALGIEDLTVRPYRLVTVADVDEWLTLWTDEEEG